MQIGQDISNDDNAIRFIHLLKLQHLILNPSTNLISSDEFKRIIFCGTNLSYWPTYHIRALPKYFAKAIEISTSVILILYIHGIVKYDKVTYRLMPNWPFMRNQSIRFARRKFKTILSLACTSRWLPTTQFETVHVHISYHHVHIV